MCVCVLFTKTDHIVISHCISRNTNLRHCRHCSSFMLDCSHARFVPAVL